MKFSISVTFILIWSWPGFIISQDGSPDLNFSQNGFALFSLSENGHCSANHVLPVSDGKLVITGGGITEDGLHHAYLQRLLPDGLEDLDFGEDGYVILSIPGVQTYGIQSLLLPDGSILTLEGRNDNYEDIIALHRLFPDGQIDQSFGQDGLAMVELGTHGQSPRSMGVQSDGGIIIGGFVQDQALTETRFFVSRLLPNGAMDLSFGDQGKVLSDSKIGFSKALALVVQPDDRILISGFETINEQERMVVHRYLPGGIPDSTFHDDGAMTFSYANAAMRASGMVVQPDGKIVLGGRISSAIGNADFIAVRMHEDGTLDESFHQDGVISISVTPYFDGANSIALQPDGKIVLAGYGGSNAPQAGSTAIIRLNADGTPDNSFADNGILDFDAFPGLSEHVSHIALQTDGKIVAAGSMYNSIYNRIYVSRFISEWITSSRDVPSIRSSVAIFPNPASEQIQIQFNVSQDEFLAIYLVDLRGHHVQTLKESSFVHAGSYSESLSLNPDTPSGLYLLQLVGSGDLQLFPLVISR